MNRSAANDRRVGKGKKKLKTKYRRCFVPGCNSTLISTPDKAFIYVPKKYKGKWLKAVGLPHKSTNSTYSCCLDHFDIEEDSLDYKRYIKLGGVLRIKDGVVPHKKIFRRLNGQNNPIRELRPDRRSMPDRSVVQKPEVSSSSSVKSEIPDIVQSKIRQTQSQQLSTTTNPNISISIPITTQTDLIYTGKGTSQNTPHITPDVSQSSISILPAKQAKLISILPKRKSEFPVSRSVHPAAYNMQHIGVNHRNGNVPRPRLLTAPIPVPFRRGNPNFYNSISQPNPRPQYPTSANLGKFSNGPSVISINSKTVTGCTQTDLISAACQSRLRKHPAHSQSLFDVTSLSKVLTINTKLGFSLADIEKNPTLYLGISQTNLHLVSFIAKYCKITEKTVFIILRKIKTNEHFGIIADQFESNEECVKKDFFQNVKKIANYMKSIVFMPERNSICKLLPLAVRMDYNNLECIIDCFEIRMEGPADSMKLLENSLGYKNIRTFKYLISCTPYSFINFISVGFDGNLTNKNVLEMSSFLDLLRPNTIVLGDKKFKSCETILHKKCSVKLVTLPSTNNFHHNDNKPQDIRTRRELENLFMHVQDVIKKIRNFRMVSNDLSLHNEFHSVIDDITVIVCSLCNI